MEEKEFESVCDKIKNWHVRSTADCHKLLDFVYKHWTYQEYFIREGNVYFVHTCGWSDNEALMLSLRRNVMFWILFFDSEIRGGHYTFASSRDAWEMEKKNPMWRKRV